jgi:hypothetical protein
MTKIVIDVKDPAKVADVVKAVENALKPKPDADGRCQCPDPDIVTMSDWAGGSYCKKCGGGWY